MTKSIVDRIASGEIDTAEYAAQMRDFLNELGYDDAYEMGPGIAGIIAEQNGFAYHDPKDALDPEQITFEEAERNGY